MDPAAPVEVALLEFSNSGPVSSMIPRWGQIVLPNISVSISTALYVLLGQQVRKLPDIQSP